MNIKLLDSETLSRARQLFPHTATGHIYFNHAATGPLSTRVVAAMNEHLSARSSGAVDTYWTDVDVVKQCRERAQKLINAESPDRIALLPSTSETLNVVVAGLDWKSGDRVLMNAGEFPANVYPYLSVKQLGVELDVIKNADEAMTPELIEHSLTPRTRAVALSAVQFLSGYKADLAAIGDLCRRKNILFLVDGIQSVGAMRIDVQAMKVDAFGAGAQKWLLGPHGAGFLYVTEELQERVRQKHLGWLSPENPWNFFDYNQPLAKAARRYEGGSLNFPGVWGMNAALGTLLEFGSKRIESHVLALTRLLMDKLGSLPEFSFYSPTDDTRRSGIVTIQPTGGADTEKIFKSLLAQHITISLRHGKLRFSPHFYNSVEEVQMFIDRLTELRSVAV
jgi:selenocysteine lyase/cysteine desulfurase